MSKKRSGKVSHKKLIARYDQRRAERAAMERKMRPFKERIEAIMHAPRFTITDFWCDQCRKDVTGTGFKQVCAFREKLPTAWYTSFCPKGHRITRRITDKDTDPYYTRSLLVQRQRYDLRDLLLTPDDPRFKVLYPEAYAKLYPNGKKG